MLRVLQGTSIETMRALQSEVGTRIESVNVKMLCSGGDWGSRNSRVLTSSPGAEGRPAVRLTCTTSTERGTGASVRRPTRVAGGRAVKSCGAKRRPAPGATALPRCCSRCRCSDAPSQAAKRKMHVAASHLLNECHHARMPDAILDIFETASAPSEGGGGDVLSALT